LRRISLCSIALLVIVALIVGTSAAPALAEEPLKIPDDATAVTPDGETVSLKAYEGKLVFLTLWRTDCPACLYEIPFLNKLQREQSGKDFAVISLAMDAGKNDLIKRVIEIRQIEYPVWIGYGQPLSRYTQTQAFPTLFVIGPDGELLGYLIGAFQSYEHALAVLDQSRNLIKGKQSAE